MPLARTYTEVSYNDTVVNGRWFCGGPGAAVQNIVVPGATRCDPGFNFWTVGTHTDWFPVAGFRLGVDVNWTNIETAYAGNVTLTKAQGARPTGVYVAKDGGILGVVFRAQRSFPAGGR